MGTSWSVRCAASPELDLGRLTRAVQTRLDGIEQHMSHWRRDSLLCGFNRAPAGSWTVLAPDLAAVMRIALDIAAQSAGAFDPTIGALVDLWGFGPVSTDAPPSAAALAAARARSGWTRTRLDAGSHRLLQPGGLQLDLSGVAKGYAADAVTALLRDQKLQHSLVEVGGELVGSGLKPDGAPWWVDLEHPPLANLAPLRVALHRLAVATSGDYVRGAHNIDPASGRPATRGIVAVSVLHASAARADAWASALTILGSVLGLEIATRLRLAARLIVHDDQGWREILTPALAALL